MPWGGMPAGKPAQGVINLESGLIWGNEMFFGFDINFGMSEHSNKTYEDSRIMIGIGFDLGSVYDLPVDNLQLVYGGGAGCWAVNSFRDYVDYNENKNDLGFLAPFIKLRWKFVELSYRGLLGIHMIHKRKRYDTESGYGYEDYGYSVDGFSWNHQIMLGVYLATSKRVRK